MQSVGPISTNVVAIIQARMISSRLPGKVLLTLAGKPVLEHVVSRISMCRNIKKIVVATSIEYSDEPIKLWCRNNNIDCYRGSLGDVLDRYYRAAQVFKADAIVRITADCPVIDPTIVDNVVAGFLQGDYDFYGLAGEFPDGLDCTVFSFSAIERAWKESSLPSEREHVGPYIEKNPDLFKTGKLEPFFGLDHLRWTLDEPQDLAFLQEVFSRLHCDSRTFLASDLLALLQREPELVTINSGIMRNEGYSKSLLLDKQRNV